MEKSRVVLLIYFVLLLNIFQGKAQIISGNLSLLENQGIKLEGFNGLKSYAISSTQTDAKGNFTLNYSKADYGVGYLISSDNKPLFVILNGENIEISGQSLSKVETLQIIKGKENQYFETYAREQPRREQTLSAWAYLENIYQFDSLFSVHKTPVNAIQNEKQRIKNEDNKFLNSLPDDSYVKWFLPVRKLVSNVSVVAQYRTDEISPNILAFRKIDYTDGRLYKSGLFKDAIENHFWLLENSGQPNETMYREMNISIDSMMVQLVKDNEKLNEVTNFLFDLLERRSLFQASEYLALKVLNTTGCTLNTDLARQLETYRIMKKGNIASDILFNEGYSTPGYVSGNAPRKLSELNSKYTLVVFAAGWCPKCKEEVPEITRNYPLWKEQGVEVVLVSLDETKASYQEFVKNLPFISTCDYKKWNGKIVHDYYVFATPTMFLLDGKRKILLRPNSVKQVDAWVDWFLVKGNLK